MFGNYNLFTDFQTNPMSDKIRAEVDGILADRMRSSKWQKLNDAVFY